MRQRWTALLLAAVLCVAWLIPGAALAQEQEQLVVRSRQRDGRTVRYYYDEQARCVRAECEEAQEVYEYAYYDSGALRTETLYWMGSLYQITDFDEKGYERLLRVADEDGVLRIQRRCISSYDELGRLENHSCVEVDTSGELSGTTWGYSYHDEDDPDSPVYSEQLIFFGFRNGLRVEEGTQITFSDPEGRVLGYIEAEYGETYWEIVTTNTYDDHGNVCERVITQSAEDGSIMTTTEYQNEYNAQGLRIRVEEHQTRIYLYEDGTQSSGQEASRIAEFHYDSAGRMVQQDTYTIDGERTHTSTWAYDSSGNLLQYTVEGKLIEENVYVPLSEALWEA